MPALCALSGCSIFIASSTTTRSPSATCCALLDRDLDDGALHRAGQRVAGGGAAGLLALGPLGLLARRRPTGGGRAAEARGQHDLEALAADLDTTRCRSAGSASAASAESPAYGSISLSNSVSIQRVWTLNGLAGRSGAKAGSATTARWNGSTVGMPSTSNSSSARRERSSAWVAVAPVTISLASSESNDAGDGLAAGSKPASRRTPGPAGGSPAGDRAGGGQEVAAGVLAVDPELDRVAADRRVVVARAPRRRRCGTSRGPGRCR